MFDTLGTRPISLVVFLASAVLLLSLEFGSSNHVEAPAVAHAPTTRYASESESVVSELFVEPGELVTAGTPLATLSLTQVERELAVVEAEIARMQRLAQLEQTRLVDQNDERLLELEAELRAAERDAALAAAEEASRKQRAGAADAYKEKVSERVEKRIGSRSALDDAERQAQLESARLDRARRQARAQRAYVDRLSELVEEAPVQSPLTRTMADYYQAELKLLETRRKNLLAEIASTTLVAKEDGRVASVLSVGSPAMPGTTVVTVVPDHATEIIAYVPPDTNPDTIQAGTVVSVTEPAHACSSNATVTRRGAMVEEAPEWLRSFFRLPVHGLPVYISVPEDCTFGVGQKLTVELDPG